MKFTQYIHKLGYTLLLTLVLFWGCSTKKNTWINRNYHNLTAKYNGHFNGNEAWKEGRATLEKSHVDKFDRVLPVFRFGTVESSKSIFPQMDKAIKKAESVVNKHSMLIRGKQYCKWIDPAFMLRGKARLFKRDYNMAVEDLLFVSNQKRTDIFKYESIVWLARTYSELTMYSDAMSILDRARNDENFPKKLKPLYYATLADLYLKRGDDSLAIKPLLEAIEFTKNKRTKGRYNFIIGQILLKQQNYKDAGPYFENAIKLNPPYDLEFNARLNLARAFDKGSGNSKALRARLLKMTKDDKNEEFLDQIYYSLGELSLRDEDEPQAIKDFNSSIRLSRGNSNQKALSYRALGEIYMLKPDYRAAKAYYDSSSTFIDKESPFFKQVNEKKKSLGALIKNLDIIEVNDSLIAMAKLPKDELDKKLDEYCKKKEAEELEAKRKAEADANASNSGTNGSNVNNPNNNTQLGTANTGLRAYYVDAGRRGRGYNDFRAVWGDRPLEDNWRRSSKETVVLAEKEEIDSTLKDIKDTAELKKKKCELAKKKITDILPKTDAEFKALGDSILNAYYNAGNIYREQLADKPASAEIFEKMLTRYPTNNKYELSVYYQLYRIYLATGNGSKSDFYKNKILTNYPNSDYAKIILDPGAKIATTATKEEMDKLYTETYKLYKARNYAEVVKKADEAIAKYTDKNVLPLFAYLRAMSIGYTQNIEAFENALRSVITNYPLHPIKAEAQNALDLLTNARTKGVTGDNSTKNMDALTMFTMKSDTTHYFILYLKNKKISVSQLKNSISNFDTEFFGTLELGVNSLFLTDTVQMIIVKEFTNKDYATTYFNAIKTDSKALATLKPEDFTMYIISPNNLTLVQKQKAITNYDLYFKETYKLN